jgi:hypothetical protein
MVVAGNVANAVSHGPEAQRHGSALAVSDDGGRRWQVRRLTDWRATALLPVAGGLFAMEALPGLGLGLQRWLEQGGALVDLASDAQGLLLLSGREVKPGRWQSQIVRLRPQGGGLSQHTLVSFTALLPAGSLAAAGGRWFVGFGPGSFQAEPSSNHCSQAEGLSGSEDELRPEAEHDPVSRRALPTIR